MPGPLAALLDHVGRLRTTYFPDAERVLIAPLHPGLYPVLGVQSPWWDSFFPLFPRAPAYQREIIDSLEKHDVRWALIDETIRADGKEELSFARTNALVWAYLQENFEVVEARDQGAAMTLFRRR